MNTLEKRRARDGQHPNEEVGEGRCFQGPHLLAPDPRLPPRTSYPDSFNVGRQPGTSKEKGLSLAPWWGWGQRVLGGVDP